MKSLLDLFKQFTPDEHFDAIQHRHGLAREDPLVVFRRGEEARDHQLPHLQARARRPVLRQDLRPHQGLRVPVRQVQAPEAPRRHLREVRRRSHADQGAPRAHGPHRPGRALRAHLVPEVAAVAPGPGARHDAARHRARAVLRSLRDHRPRHDPAEEVRHHVRGRLRRQAQGIRRRVRRQDGRRRHQGPARRHRTRQRDREACAAT